MESVIIKVLLGLLLISNIESQQYQQQGQVQQQQQGQYQQQQQGQAQYQQQQQQQQHQAQQQGQVQYQQGQAQVQQVQGQHQQGQPQIQQVQQVQGQQHHQQQGGHNQNLIREKAHIQNKEHIQEHLEGVVDHSQLDPSKMTEEELQFHYFKMHDSDGNNQLDGSELCKSIIHWHVEESMHNKNSVPAKVFTDTELYNMIDPILRDDDRNNNGYIDYAEFVFAQQARSQ